MKGCFFLGRRFAYIGHAMAMQLKERYGIEDFCAYVTLRSSLEFLESQNDIQYTRLFLDEDIHRMYPNEKIDVAYLRQIEQEYGIPNLWPYLEIDRLLRHGQFLRAYPYDASRYSHEDLLKIVHVTARTLIDFLEHEKPDFILFSAITHVGSLLFYHIAKKKGITTFVIDSPRIENRFFISESFNRSTYLEETYKRMKTSTSPSDEEFKKKAQKFLREFQEKPHYYLDSSAAGFFFKKTPIKRREHFRFLRPGKIGISLAWLWKSFADYLRNTHTDDYTTIKPWHEIIDKAKRKLRVLRGYSDLYDPVTSDEDYVYFALHTEPETYPMLLAPFYTDQLWIIKQVARSLPVNMKLYVKDHPIMVGFRPRSYYKELKKIPNVRLIDPGVSGLELNERSRMTMTITGTSGWEGVLLKKPVIIFGDIYYSMLSAVKKCQDITMLPYLVKEQLEHFSYNEKELTDFIAAIYAESVPVDLVKIWDIDGGSNMENNMREMSALVDVIANRLHLSSRIV